LAGMPGFKALSGDLRWDGAIFTSGGEFAC